MCLDMTPSLSSVFTAKAESVRSSMLPWGLIGFQDRALYCNWLLLSQFPVLEGRHVSGT